MFDKLKLIVLRESTTGQGKHIDPEAPGAPASDPLKWSKEHRQAYESARMEVFRDCLRIGDTNDLRTAVIDDLAVYHDIGPEEAVERCLDWEAASVVEWERAPRDSRDALVEFYSTVESWSFDLLWYAYLQATGYGYPESVIVAGHLDAEPPGRRFLDFGSGSGVTSQLFAKLGYEVTLADVSAPLLAFARFRFERRGMTASYLNLTEQELPRDSFDVVAAVDSLAHVPDIKQTAVELHVALKDGGLLFANFDVRRPSKENAWHLYDDDLVMRYAVERAGFMPRELIDNTIWIYEKRPAAEFGAIHRAWRWLRLASPVAHAIRGVRRTVAYGVLGIIERMRAR